MGINERKEQEIAIRKQDIISAAETLFLEKGVEGTSMEDIAKAAEFTKRTLYFYFSGKEELLASVLIRAYRLCNGYFAAIKMDELTGSEIIDHLGTSFLEFYSSYPGLFLLMLQYEPAQQDFSGNNTVITELYAEAEKTLDFIINAVKKGVDDHSLRGDLNPTTAGLTIWAMISGAYVIAVRKEEYLVSYHHTTGNEIIKECMAAIRRYIAI